jgi:nucleoside-diphosphate-sugar epimerase
VDRAGAVRRVAVTGQSTPLGRALLDRLEGRADLALLGLDRADRRFRGVDTVVHLGTTYDQALPAERRRTLNVAGTTDVLTAASAAGVGHVVVVTSTDVYAARPDNAVPLPDDAPLRDDLVTDHVEVEELVAGQTGLSVAVLRPATLVGGALGPAYDGARLSQLSGPRLLAARGIEPLWQLCHAEDLLAALELTVVAGLTGPLPVACDSWLQQRAVEELAGMRRVELPGSVAVGTADRLRRLGLSTSSPQELDHLLAPVVVACDRLRAAGWSPAWTNESALRGYLADRDRSGRTGVYTAAGATVALLGTAALVRQARRRRRGR